MKFVKEFIKYLCGLNLSLNPRNISNDMYNELETYDVDLEAKEIEHNAQLPLNIKFKILDLLKFYYLNADDCINKYSDKECYEFLEDLKMRAEEVNSFILLI